MSSYQGLRHLHVFGNRMHQLAQIFFGGIFNSVYEFGSFEAVRPSLVIRSFCHSFIIISRLLELISDLPHPHGRQVKELCNGGIAMSGTNGKQHTFPFLWKSEFFFWSYFFGRCTARCQLSKKIKFYPCRELAHSPHAFFHEF